MWRASQTGVVSSRNNLSLRYLERQTVFEKASCTAALKTWATNCTEKASCSAYTRTRLPNSMFNSLQINSNFEMISGCARSNDQTSKAGVRIILLNSLYLRESSAYQVRGLAHLIPFNPGESGLSERHYTMASFTDGG